VFGGMILASFIGIFAIPPLYVTFQALREKLRPGAGPHGAEPPPCKPEHQLPTHGEARGARAAGANLVRQAARRHADAWRTAEASPGGLIRFLWQVASPAAAPFTRHVLNKSLDGCPRRQMMSPLLRFSA